jgi:hypothetical protein
MDKEIVRLPLAVKTPRAMALAREHKEVELGKARFAGEGL